LLVLSPHGHIEHHAVVFDDGITTWLDVEPSTAPGLMEFLTRMRFALRVEPVNVGADWTVLSLVGPQVDSVLQTIGVSGLTEPQVVPVPGPRFASGTVPSGPTSRYPGAALEGGGFVRRMGYGADLVVARSTVDAWVARLGIPLAGIWAFEALRVERRAARLGKETDHRTLPAEVDWLAGAVHLEKGCYRGQETVARVHNLGRPPRRLVLLHLDGIRTGRVGTAVRHAELGPVALALVKRSIGDDTPLRIGETSAAIDRD
jgi:folate-binding protein YgfZ